MDFSNAKKLLELCDSNGMSISEVMKQREYDEGTSSKEEIIKKMRRVLEIMRDSATTPVNTPMKSMGGLIGGEAKKLNDYSQEKKNIGGSVLSRGIMYAVAVLECNASMGLIVAAPTAGSSGVVPGLLLAMQDVYSFSDEKVIDALFASGAIGYLAMRNATVAGAVGGCQAEMGVASAMAAAAAVAIMGGSPAQSAHAFAMALGNLLGLVCDPVAGLVEVPCVKRNTVGSTNALICADMALAGIENQIPADEVIEAMYKVGRNMPRELRETGLGGLADTPTGNRIKMRIFGREVT